MSVKCPRLVLALLALHALLMPAYAASLADPDSVALRARSQVLLEAGHFAEASAQLQPLHEYYHAAQNWPALVDLTIERATILQRSQQPEDLRRSVLLLQQHADLVRTRLPATHPGRWTLTRKIGVGYHKLGDYPAAIPYYEAALEGLSALPQASADDRLQGNLNIALAHYEMGHYTGAVEYGKRALAFRERAELRRLVSLYKVLGRSYLELGDLHQAAVYHNYLLTHYRQRAEEEPWMLAEFLVDLSILAYQRRQLDSSLFYAGWSRDILLEMGEWYWEDSVNLANALHNMADAEVALGRYPEALDHYRRARRLHGQLFGPASLQVARNLNNTGLAHFHMEQWDQAERDLKRALRIKQSREEWLDEQSSTWENLGDVYLARGDPEGALQAYQQALVSHLPHFARDEMGALPTLEETADAADQVTILLLAALGRAHLALYDASGKIEDLREAHRSHRLAIDLIDRLRRSYRADESKQFLVQQTRPIFETAIATCLALDEIAPDPALLDQAFAFSEGSKSIILLDAVHRSQVRAFAGVDDRLLARERDARAELSWLDRQIRRQRLQGHTDALDSLLRRQLEQQLAMDRLMEQIERDHPDYFRLMHAMETIDPSRLQAEVLRPGEALISYFVGAEQLFLFYLSPEEVRLVAAKRDPALRERIERLRHSMYAPFTAGKGLSTAARARLDSVYAAEGHRLYRQLFDPLSGLDLPERLILVPDDVLGYLPFEALLSGPAARPGAYGRLPYLLRDHDLSYAYSASLLAEMRRKAPGEAGSSWLGLAPTFGTEGPAGLAPLRYNQDEVRRIADLMDGRAICGEAASKDRFVGEASEFGLLHLSSHGRAHDEAPNDSSYLAFAGAAPFLYAWELYDLPLQAEMVVLSVCETGLGKLQRGEGIISMARAFAYAGARSVVTTLWQVDDQASADLMVGFYEGLQAGMPKDVALASAKRAMLDRPGRSAPYYWAGFIATGDMAPLPGSERWPRGLIWLGLGLLVGWMLWWRRRELS